MANDNVEALNGLLSRVHANQTAFVQAKALYQNRLAAEFNPFQFIKLDELGLSKVIGWMLNPKGSHAQGGLFLHLFVKKLGIPWSRDVCDVAETWIEAYAGIHGRIDVLVRSGKFGIAIENKSNGAIDQPDQLTRYFNYLEKEGVLDPRVVYLTIDALEPTSVSISKENLESMLQSGKLCLVGFKVDFLKWVVRCRQECRADRVAIFLDEFARFVRENLCGVADVSESDRLVSEVTKTKESVAAAMSLIIARDDIQKRLMDKLRLELLGASEWSLVWDLNPKAAYTGFGFDYGDKCPGQFRIQFDSTDYSNACCGFRRREQSGVDSNAFDESVDIFNLKMRNAHWFWYLYEHDACPIPRYWNNNSKPWIDIQTGDMARTIISGAKMMHDALQLKGLV